MRVTEQELHGIHSKAAELGFKARQPDPELTPRIITLCNFSFRADTPMQCYYSTFLSEKEGIYAHCFI